LKDAQDQHGERSGRHPVFRPNFHRHNIIMYRPGVNRNLGLLMGSPGNCGAAMVSA
jgi:hypothetical protein